MRIVLITLGVTTLGASAGVNPLPRNWERNHAPSPPAPLPVDPIQNVGHAANQKVRSFVDGQLGASQFEDEHDFPVDKEGGGLCILTVRAMKNSQYIPRKNDQKPNGYVVALIRNQNNCKPKRFALGKNERAAWIVRFDSQEEYADGRVVGTAYLVSLNGIKDDFLGSWSFWQCGSKHGDIPDKASAVMQNEATHGAICGTAYTYGHSAAKISAERMNAFRSPAPAVKASRAALFEQGDPAIWFACGTDCCYSELRS